MAGVQRENCFSYDSILIAFAFAFSAYLRHKGIQGFEMLGPAASCLLLIDAGCILPCKTLRKIEFHREQEKMYAASYKNAFAKALAGN